MTILKDKIVDKKYGFPVFCKPKDCVYLGNGKELIISDIWAFWDYVIKKKNVEKQFLLSLLEQAKHFYETAEKSPTKSQPLLYYYSFLNLAKVMINIEKNYGYSKTYSHGIKEKNAPNFNSSKIDIIHNVNSDNIQVGAKLLEVLDGAIINSTKTIRYCFATINDWL